MHASFLSLSIPAPLSSLEQPLEVPQRTGRWALWADSLKHRCQTDQQAGRCHTERHTYTHTNGETGQDGRSEGERKHYSEETRLYR